MSGWQWPHRRVYGLLAGAIAYLALSYLLLRSILGTYVVADDFQAPFAEAGAGATTLLRSVSYGWRDSAASGDRTRVVGWVIGSVFNWLWLWLARTFGFTILDVYAAIKFVMLVACAVALSALWWEAARRFLRPVRWSTALLLTSTALFGTLQLHGQWSNDPVESYPLAGYASAAVGFGLLALVVRATTSPTKRRLAGTTLAGVLAVSYYEFNLGAILGGGLILLVAAWTHRQDRRELRTRVLGAVVFVLTPILWLFVSGAQNSGASYSGRALHAGGALKTFAISIVSSLPGSAWHLSAAILNNNDAIELTALLVAILAVAVASLWVFREARWAGGGTAVTSRPSLPMFAAVAAAVVIYGGFALALEAATAKVEQQTLQIGYVYTSYAVGSGVVALALAVAVWMLFTGGRRRRWLAAVVGLVAVAVFTVQGSFNIHLDNLTDSSIAENQQVDNAFAAGVPQAQRCAAIRNWISYPWPGYYANTVLLGTEVGYRVFFGQTFCRDLVAPSQGFGPEFGPPSLPQWWLYDNSGSIVMRVSGCEHGCSGTLRFQAGGFAKPHTVTLSVPGFRRITLAVPDHWMTYALHIRLRATYDWIGVRATGTGSTPQAMHVGPGTIPLLVEFESLRFQRDR
ncbi:MAG: hypothetical protein ACP5H2_02600 [Solirubrobacteraceae bacterium]